MMKQILFTNWHITRWVRLAFALFLFAQAYITQDWFFILFGIFFFVQAIFNFVCGINGCSIPNKK